MLRKLLTEEQTADRLPLDAIHQSIKEIQQKLEEEIISKQAVIDGSWSEIRTLRATVKEKEAMVKQLEAAMAESQRNNEGNRQIINKLLNDLDKMQQEVEWYKRTYETRSLMGIIKDKLKTVFVNNK